MPWFSLILRPTIDKHNGIHWKRRHTKSARQCLVLQAAGPVLMSLRSEFRTNRATAGSQIT